MAAASFNPAAPPTYDDAIASSPPTGHHYAQQQQQQQQQQQHHHQQAPTPGAQTSTLPHRAQTQDPASSAAAASSQPRTQPRRRRPSQPEQALPLYTRCRADDPEYIGLLERWAQTKMYIVPGQDGTLNAGGVRRETGEGMGGDGQERRRRMSGIGSLLRRLKTR